ncbi:hypothetical protein [Xanthomonas sp. XNM01]|uniref:XAC0095 family protein n=1 Tax=Xanthomonas sp. XNM01 TaxID=2769289 RepID=UPI0017872F96|nr:hypothetical protein [Xanthomonas sp. XNM01]MBD9368616.1 hypothetical protein [Xanthomonas sp. XNM01]
MSTHEMHAPHGSHDPLGQDGRLQLTRLSAHLRFLARLAQPCEMDNTHEGPPGASADELAFSLHLLADRLDELSGNAPQPPSRAGMSGTSAQAAASEDEVEDDPGIDDEEVGEDDADEAATGDLVFGVTLDQIDTLNRLVHAITAHGDVVAASDMAEYADGTLSQMGHVVFDAGLEVRAVLDEVESQRLAERPPPQRVREPHAAYGPVAHVAARLH